MKKLSAAHVSLLKAQEQKVGKLFDDLLTKMKSSTSKNVERRAARLVMKLFEELHTWVHLYVNPPGTKRRTISREQEQYLSASVFTSLGAFLAMNANSAEFLKEARPSFKHIKKYV